MWYLILYGVFAAWVLFDGMSRKDGGAAVGWTIGTLLLGPLVLPVYLAKRPLKTGEVREGGTAWNVLKNFAILWTILMAVAAFSAVSSMGDYATNLQSDAERAGAGIGMFLGMGLLAVVWLVPTAGAALLGFLLKKNTIIENGPTGPLVGTESNAGIVNGYVGLIAAAIVGLVLIGATSHRGTSPSGSTSATEASVGSKTVATPDSSSGWRVSQKKNEMDNTREAILSLDSETELQGFIGKERPRLAIQCHEGKPPEVVVNVGKVIESEYGQFGTHSVRVKYDDAAPVRQRWTESTDNVALFSPAPAAMLKQLTKSEIFLFEFTPFQETAKTAKFNLAGLKSQLQTVASICGVSF